MSMSPTQLRYMLIVISAIFAIYALTIELGEGRSPGIGIAMAAGLALLIISAARSGPRSRRDRDTKR